MNPYLERADLWQDFHTRFLADSAEALSPQVRASYLVHIEDHVFSRELPRELWRPIGRPDIAQARRPDAPGRVAAATIEAGEEVELMVTIDEVTQRYLEIRDRRSREVVTIIELLSPSNKALVPDRERIRILAGAANLVEIDLLRGGPRLPLGEPPPICDYCALVSQARRRPKASLSRVRLRDRLPTVPIPLKPEDGDAQLDLQAILNRVYDAGTYEAEIYATPPEPPLNADDAAWAAQFVTASQNQ
jgi:hypothetical protein